MAKPPVSKALGRATQQGGKARGANAGGRGKPCLTHCAVVAFCSSKHNNANGYPSALFLLRQTLPASMPCTSCNCSQQQEQHPVQGTIPGMLCRKPSTIMVCHPSVQCVVQRAAPILISGHADRLAQTRPAIIARTHGHAIRSSARAPPHQSPQGQVAPLALPAICQRPPMQYGTGTRDGSLNRHHPTGRQFGAVSRSASAGNLTGAYAMTWCTSVTLVKQSADFKLAVGGNTQHALGRNAHQHLVGLPVLYFHGNATRCLHQ